MACGVRQQRVEGERASWQGGLWGWQWVGAAVVAEVGEEVEAVEAGEWKQGLARGSGEGGGPVNWTWCCCYLHAALSTGAAELLTSRSSAHLRRMGWGSNGFGTQRKGVNPTLCQPLKKAPKKAPKIYGQWSVSGQKNLELSQWSSVVMEMLNFRSVWELVLVVMG